jgi:hypothetical protein
MELWLFITIKGSIPYPSQSFLYCVFVCVMNMLANPDTETQSIQCDILLPSNEEWRMKNYYKLVEQQRAMDANL